MSARGTEADLAARVVVHLRTRAWEVYCEVAGIPNCGDRRPDIVAVRADRVLLIECKQQFGWAVLHQAEPWVGWPDGVLVATGPGPRKGTETAARAVAALGLGWLVVDAGEVREVVQPPHGLTVPGKRALLLDALRPEQQASVPGNADSAFWTASDEQRAALVRVIAGNPGIPLRLALTTAGIRGLDAEGLRRWAKAARNLEGVRATGRGVKLELHPETEETL